MAIVPDQVTLGLRRQFTTAGVHPYEEIDWERRDARIVNALDGTVAFEQLDVEVPAGWSAIAVNILAQKYFRGALGSDEREHSLTEVVDRVVGTIVEWGTRDGYFATPDERVRITVDRRQAVYEQRFRSRPNLVSRANLPDTLVVEVKFHRRHGQLGARVIEGIPVRVSRNSKYALGVQSMLT